MDFGLWNTQPHQISVVVDPGRRSEPHMILAFAFHG